VVAVLQNTRFSAVEIDRVLADAGPHGLIRDLALPAPTVQVPWQRALDKETLELQIDSCPEPIYDPDAVLALIYTSGTTGHPKGVMLTHAATLANVDHLSYWMPYHEGGVYLHAAPLFHMSGHDSEVQPRGILRDGTARKRELFRARPDNDQPADAVSRADTL
jgi:acyl-CoA synthetase (AMP-forming)/AMP-acid ligase II